MCPGTVSAFPDFVPGDFLTAEGENGLETVHRIGTGVSTAVALLSGIDLLKPNGRDNVHLKDHQRKTSNGGKAIKGPLLIIHDRSDPVLSVTRVENAVKETAERFPSAQIQYVYLLA